MIRRIYTCALLVALLSTASCKRDKFYRCICTTGGGSIYGKSEITKLGRIPKEQAYEMCRSKVTGKSVECIMEVH